MYGITFDLDTHILEDELGLPAKKPTGPSKRPLPR